MSEPATPDQKKDEVDGGLEAVRAYMEKVEPAPEIARDAGGDGDPGPDPDPGRDDQGRGGGRAGGGPGLPDDCPVAALGIKGDSYYFLDAARQFRELNAGKFGRTHILSLFQHRGEALKQIWPGKRDKDGVPVAWDHGRASEELIQICAARGIWDPFEQLRGAGAWQGDDGELVLHCGDVLIRFPRAPDASGEIAPTIGSPGPRGRYVYPAAPAGPRPAEESPPFGDLCPARALMDLFETWNWQRPSLDPLLLLGWLGGAIIGGALDWRPAAWITGGKGTGKSYLIKLLKMLMGDTGMVAVADASGAGIWQKLGYATLPVVLDEQESDEDNRPLNKVLKLARLASSGGLILRGGADHQATEFVARSSFLFQSIITPPFLPQDRSRLAILDLLPLKGGQEPPPLDPRRLRALGAQLRRRLAENWGRLDQVLHHYRAALEAEGHDSRGADQYGTLLAIADILTLPAAESGVEASDLAAKLSAESAAGLGDDADAEFQCLKRILSSSVEGYRGGLQESVATYIAKATGRLTDGTTDGGLVRDAQKVLATVGCKVVKDEGFLMLAVANNHEGLSRLYAGTQWATRAGASEAPWVRQLRRLPGAYAGRKTEWIGTSVRVTLLPLRLVFPAGTDWKALAEAVGVSLLKEFEGTDV